MKKPAAKKKKPHPKAMPTRKKILVAGLLTAFGLQAVGWPVAARLGWIAAQEQKRCIVQIQDRTAAISRGPHATGDTVADAALGRAAAENTVECQSADAAYRATNRFIYWMSFAAVLAVSDGGFMIEKNLTLATTN